MNAPHGDLDGYLRERLAECRLPERYYAWVEALDPIARSIRPDGTDDYVLDGADLRAGWEAVGIGASGRGKAITGALEHGSVRLSSAWVGLRGSSELALTLNLRFGRVTAGSALHALAAEILEAGGRPLPSPPYPRPTAYGPGDVHWYLARVAELFADLLAACDRAGPPDLPEPN